MEKADLKDFDADGERWKCILTKGYGEAFADRILKASRLRFRSLIPSIPYIGGEESWSGSLLEAARCLGLFMEMKAAGKTAEETGQVLYEAVLSQLGEVRQALQPENQLSQEEMMERRRKRAALSQERRCPEGYVAEFVFGEGENFDYGYNFLECAAQKFYKRMEAEEFLPYFCKLDFAYSQLFELGLKRTIILAEGGAYCNHRFKVKEIPAR